MSADDDHAKMTRDQWIELYAAIQCKDDDHALETLLQVRPENWPQPEDMLDEIPEGALDEVPE